MLTPFHASYFAHELSRSERGDVGKALFNACVELNPHQIEGASFALRNPLSPGVLLADEVGLGKTIQAGLVLCQKWAEKKRRLLVVCPASLRRQWSLELAEKFNLPCTIVDATNAGTLDQREQVVIVSYHFAANRVDQIRDLLFDLAVIDEAHKLRNVHKPENQLGRKIKAALAGRRKILLTATPLQNSLMELYGLSTILSDEIFGSAEAFREQYVRTDRNLPELKDRLQPYCKRTLRRDVHQYIDFKKRFPLTFQFCPTDAEQSFYEAVSAYLLRNDCLALAKAGRQLIEILCLKLLASSPSAIAHTLEGFRRRLIDMQAAIVNAGPEEVFEDEDLDPETREAFDRERACRVPAPSADDDGPSRAQVAAELRELNQYIQWAHSIQVDTKRLKLLEGLRKGFQELRQRGAAEKGLVFTESRRTQRSLRDFLEANGFAGRIVLFDGTNSDPQSAEIIDRWIQQNEARGRVTGQRVVDARLALVEHFRDSASIMLATEAAAEGINLQFCSMVVNYDLPWNPQRVEQRIGRCHRYGQKHDVVVVNFLNERNRADIRVHELLDEKFHLFHGLFGASDEVLGAIESGVDFEKKILEIHRRCRTPDKIDEAFNKLREELKPQIEKGMSEARQTLLDQFDQSVHDRLKLAEKMAHESLDRMDRIFWGLTQFMLRDRATIAGDAHAFDLHRPPLDHIRPGRYELISKTKENIIGDFLYRMSHPLGDWVIDTASRLAPSPALVRFDLSRYPKRIAMLEELKGQSGWLSLQKLTITSLDNEDFLLFSGVTDGGRSIGQEECERLFLCNGEVGDSAVPTPTISRRLKEEGERHIQGQLNIYTEKNSQLFRDECQSIDQWGDEVRRASDTAVKEIDEQISAIRKERLKATTLDQEVEFQTRLSELNRTLQKRRQERDRKQDEVHERCDELVARVKRKMDASHIASTLFTLRWEIV